MLWHVKHEPLSTKVWRNITKSLTSMMFFKEEETTGTYRGISKAGIPCTVGIVLLGVEHTHRGGTENSVRII